MKNKIMSGVVIFGLILLMVIVIAIGVYLVPLSHEVATANPTISHMRVPVLIIAWLCLACVVALLILALAFMTRITRNKIFEQKSVSLLKAMGFISLAPIPVLIYLYFYTAANVAGSITNLWVMFAGLGLVIVSVFFFLLASVFQKSVHYKTDNELTI